MIDHVRPARAQTLASGGKRLGLELGKVGRAGGVRGDLAGSAPLSGA